MGTHHPPHFSKRTMLVPAGLRRRVHALYSRLGTRRKAMDALAVNEHTMASLLDLGMLRDDTIARIEAKLTELGV